MKMEKKRNIVIGILILIIALIIVIIIGSIQFNKSHFQKETFIQGVDCGRLDAESAKARLEENFCKEVSFIVTILDDETYVKKQYSLTTDQIENLGYGIKLEAIQEVFEAQQENKELKEFQIDDIFSLNEEFIKQYLKNIPELQEENMMPPQDAHLQEGENGLLEIVPEKYGYEVDFEKACDFAIQELKAGNSTIDFTQITKKNPEIFANDPELNETMERINKAVSTVINYTLLDGSTVTLDRTTTKNWIHFEEDNTCTFQEECDSFLQLLSEKIENSNSSINFSATKLGNIIVTINTGARAKLDKGTEKSKILENFTTGQTYTRSPSYTKKPVQQNLNDYVELDITRQTLWLYLDKKCVLETPVVTGNESKGNGTPTGIYFLTYKSKNATLTDNKTYWSNVDYWMPFNGGIGFHDAYRWRKNYGGTIYLANGSHGCVNMPLEAAKTLYENITTKMPIIIYKS